MYRLWQRMCGTVLALIMLVNLLPMSTLAQDFQQYLAENEEVTSVTASTETETDSLEASPATIVDEIMEKRTEYSKEFLLSNGLHMAAVYADPVHYETSTGWAEIDNTLKANTDGSYRNTAGIWDVTFPQQLGGANAVTITKDGYTLSFAMAGELRSSGQLTAQAQDLVAANLSSAQVQTIDTLAMKEEAEHPEAIPDKLQSRILYADIYSNTHVQYDLDSNKVKESIVLESYSATLQGYSYTLNVGQMVPVLQDDGSILFYDKEQKNIVMVMPAPYLVDSAKEYNSDIEVQLVGKGSTYILAYTLPQEWLAAEDRSWPVILDPVVSPALTTSNIRDMTVSSLEPYGNMYILDAGYSTQKGIKHAYLKYAQLPGITSSDVVVNATVRLYKTLNHAEAMPVHVHKVTGAWESSSITWANKPAPNPNIEDYALVGAEGWYTWVVTDIVREWYTGENTGMMFKSSDAVETAQVEKYRQFFSSDYTDNDLYQPVLFIEFRNNNGLEGYWDYTSSSAGRAGTGYVNNFTGNLIWTRDDMGFGGNLMPVSISHVYNLNDSTVPSDQNNSNDSGGNSLGLGNGWRTNYNQLVYRWEITDGTLTDAEYYIWEDGDGTDHYFKYFSANTYKVEDGMELTLTTNGTGTEKYKIISKNGNTSFFDTQGRLTKIQNDQDTKSSITITYKNATSRLIKTITDGVGRVYNFEYVNDYLSQLQYLGTGTEVLESVTYYYTSSCLTAITDIDGKTVRFTYEGSKLKTAKDIDGYQLTYDYNTPAESYQPYRVQRVSETDITPVSGTTPNGGSLTFEYAHNQTRQTDHKGNVNLLQFNDLGNLTCIQDDEGRALFGQYAKNSTNDTGKANQLNRSSKLQNTVSNLLSYSSFETGNDWSTNSDSLAVSRSTAYAYEGEYSLKLSGNEDTLNSAVSSDYTVAPEESVTFSAYIKGASNYGCIALVVNGTVHTGPSYACAQDWTRLEVSYTNNSAETVTVLCGVFTEAAGDTYLDCVQLEKNPTASRYNLVENGDFRYASGWTANGSSTSSETRVTNTAAVPGLDNTVYQIVGNPEQTRSVWQYVKTSGSAGDSYVLSGWARGDSAPLTSAETATKIRRFCLKAIFHNTDGTTTERLVSFNPDTDSQNSWQYVAAPVIADKAYTSIQVAAVYDYNVNTVYFDGIQLYKEQFGSSYTYDSEGNVTSVQDLQGQTTQYEYDDDNNLTKVIQNDEVKVTYTYDNHHNVLTSTTQEGLAYTLGYDTFGNNTSVSVGSGDSKITTTATYTTDGNRLQKSTDALGKETTYSYDENTNVLDWVRYPEDSEATRTNYTYDNMYRMATATATTDKGANLSATYTYEDDLLTAIQTPETRYSFDYGNFSLRTGVSIGDYDLATYSYTEDGRNLLSELDYGNGGMIQYSYDDKGRITQQTYEDGDTVTFAYDNSGALATVTDSATGIKTTHYYDLTDRLMKYTETGTDYSHSVGYSYDQLNNLTALKETINGTERTNSYTYDDDNRVTSVTADGTTVDYTYDAWGRLSQKVTKQGETTIKSETFTYTPHNAATSGQVASHSVTYDGITTVYDYTYDDNGNIIAIDDGSDVISYEYDSAGQLSRENNETLDSYRVFAYDNAGNILSSGTAASNTGTETVPSTVRSYVYGDSDWGDLLTGYNGKTISYDEIGNPLTYGNRSYSWEHGRELATLTENGITWTYTYDANGMRTKRTDQTTTYTYIYNGSQLTQMTVDGYTFNFTYDAAGTPLTVTMNGNLYYYVTNLQGDVIRILNSNGEVVETYNYDAWGKHATDDDDSIGDYNPLRYRGYVYDSETGLYYLQSRYYDPEVGRFINGDGLVSTGQGPLGNNMFSYCGNNPANRVDETGKFWEEWLEELGRVFQQSSAYFATSSGVALVDSPAPGPADIIAAGMMLGGALACLVITTYTTITASTSSTSMSKVEAKAETKTKDQSPPTIIYRYGGTNPGNLTPKMKDKYSGLSFSTVPQPGAAMTTIEALNATGVVYAVKDGPTHVSVRPRGGTIEDWVKAGSSSIWTNAIKLVVIKWDG